MPDLPTGTVTFLFTDIEGSTPLLERLGERYRDVQERHNAIVRAAIGEGDGREMSTEGDSFFAVFATPAAPSVPRSVPSASWRRRNGRTGRPFGSGWDCTPARRS